jgi:hypothetical protein
LSERGARLFERGADLRELAAQTCAQIAQHANQHNRQQTGEQRVFDGRGAVLIVDKITNKPGRFRSMTPCCPVRNDGSCAARRTEYIAA